MEYLVILAFLALGIGFHVGEKVFELDKLSPDDTLWDVFKLLWKTDKITILISVFLIIPFVELIFWCCHIYWIDLLKPEELENSILKYFNPACFFAGLLLGYAGQRLIYGALGKSVVFAEKKLAEKLQS